MLPRAAAGHREVLVRPSFTPALNWSTIFSSFRSSGAFRVWTSGADDDYELFVGRNVSEVEAESKAAGVIPVGEL